jgi:hypothetical protein
MEIIFRGSGYEIGPVLVDEKRYILLEKLGWMTSRILGL